ncbi:MAG: thioesterase family protein [Saprospiraceae bacterium]
MDFRIPIQVRWSDLDPNAHLRHSVYYDWGAVSRVAFFTNHGLSTAVLHELQIGPVLFREECVFKKEIHFEDQVTIDLQLLKARKDFSRWTIHHNIYKHPDVIAAMITVEGAWIDLVKRKLTQPPSLVIDLFNDMNKREGFMWDEK